MPPAAMDKMAFITGILLIFSIFLDSVCNDICAHYLACAVYDKTLSEAKKIKTERALRAARELQDHDIACKVMKAGPTSQVRCAELGACEKTSRAAVGTVEEAATFAKSSTAGASAIAAAFVFSRISLFSVLLSFLFS